MTTPTTTPAARRREKATRCRGFYFPFFPPAGRATCFFFCSRRRGASSVAANRAVAGRMDRRIAQRSSGKEKKTRVERRNRAKGERAPCRERRVRRLSEKPVLNLRKSRRTLSLADAMTSLRYTYVLLSVCNHSPLQVLVSLCY